MDLLEKDYGQGLIGGGVSLGLVLRFQKADSIANVPLVFMIVDKDVNSQSNPIPAGLLSSSLWWR